MLDEVLQNQIFCSILHTYVCVWVTAPETSVKLGLDGLQVLLDFFFFFVKLFPPEFVWFKKNKQKRVRKQIMTAFPSPANPVKSKSQLVRNLELN